MSRGLACVALLAGAQACATRDSEPKPAQTAVVVPAASAEQEREEAELPDAAGVSRSRSLSECRAPADVNLEEAKREFQLGVEAMVKDDAVTAADIFQRSYERTCNPVLLYNLGVVREKLGDVAGAVEALEEYLARQPQSFRTDEVKRRIQELRARER